MAVVFTPNAGEAITIGGTTATGPFPKYSISTERTETGDGTLLDLTYSITVTGQVLATGDLTAAGARQDSLQAATIAKLVATESATPVGQLEIISYGGLTNVLQFNDAVLQSIDFGEQDDDSGGVQYQEYTFNFVAHKRSSKKTGSAYTLSSAEESWDIAENSEFTYVGNDITSTDTKKTYTITHTVSATGYNKHTDAAFNDSGWKQAKDWVIGRLVTNPNTQVSTNAASGTNFTNFKGTLMGGVGASEVKFIDLTTDSVYNHGRVATSDLTGGAYSVTETWYVSPVKVTHEVDISYDEGEDGAISVTVSGSIAGLSTSSFSSKKQNKITQADDVLNTVLGKTFSLASAVYGQLAPTGTVPCPYALNPIERTKSISKNKVSGVITYSLAYNDSASVSSNTISESLSVSDDNEDHTNNIVAIIQIMGRANGPIFQDMSTTNERKRNVNLEWIMDRCNRNSKPSSEALAIAVAYIPGGTVYQLSKSESWDASTGSYSLSIEWAY